MAALLADRYDPSTLVIGDQFFGFLRTGAIPPWLPESGTQNTAVVEAAALATGRLAQHATTVYDGVIGPWYLDTFLAGTGVTTAAYVMLLPPLEVCLQRVATRTDHEFDDPEATRQMWQEFAEATIDPRHVVSSADSTPDELVDRLQAGLADGHFTAGRTR